MESGETSIQHDPQVYGSLPFAWAARSDTGRLRDNNEDAYLIEPEAGLFILSDGMGGHRGGELASIFVTRELSVQIEAGFHKLRSQSRRSILHLIKRSIRRYSDQVRLEGDSESGCKDMGATVVVVMICGGRAYVANLGDSRLYRYRNQKLRQISRDHSVVGELIEAGKLRPDQAENHEAEGQITQYMGMDQKAAPHLRSFLLQRNDRLLLCSDGLTDMLSDQHIAPILQQNPDPQDAVDQLIGQANEAGGVDNITAVLIDYSRTPRTAAAS